MKNTIVESTKSKEMPKSKGTIRNVSLKPDGTTGHIVSYSMRPKAKVGEMSSDREVEEMMKDPKKAFERYVSLCKLCDKSGMSREVNVLEDGTVQLIRTW